MRSLFFQALQSKRAVNKLPKIQEEFVIEKRINKKSGNIEYVKTRNPNYKDGDVKKDEEKDKEVVIFTITREEYIDQLIEEIEDVKESLNF